MDELAKVALRINTINSAMEQLRLRRCTSDSDTGSSRSQPSTEIRGWIHSQEKRLFELEQRLKEGGGLTKLLADQQSEGSSFHFFFACPPCPPVFKDASAQCLVVRETCHSDVKVAPTTSIAQPSAAFEGIHSSTRRSTITRNLAINLENAEETFVPIRLIRFLPI
ncbi:unnamed protein product [Nippostrongylus brasiliensis]|uniref:Uncharacterized protein n=1 Tax=Nippostrongylus brasiliensis TaxID=27835 RepID=A0A0N4Y0T7_NIPBR|nr:unnamed protein product [Nippostrongylus brasiliensis]